MSLAHISVLLKQLIALNNFIINSLLKIISRLWLLPLIRNLFALLFESEKDFLESMSDDDLLNSNIPDEDDGKLVSLSLCHILTHSHSCLMWKGNAVLLTLHFITYVIVVALQDIYPNHSFVLFIICLFYKELDRMQRQSIDRN